MFLQPPSRQGRIVYWGPGKDVIYDYFNQAGHVCPSLTNPADHFIDLASIDVRDVEAEKASEERVGTLVEHYTVSTRRSLLARDESAAALAGHGNRVAPEVAGPRAEVDSGDHHGAGPKTSAEEDGGSLRGKPQNAEVAAPQTKSSPQANGGRRADRTSSALTRRRAQMAIERPMGARDRCPEAPRLTQKLCACRIEHRNIAFKRPVLSRVLSRAPQDQSAQRFPCSSTAPPSTCSGSRRW